MHKNIIFILCFLAYSIVSHKIAIFTVDFPLSQVIWANRIAETLTHAHHNVTVIRFQQFGPNENELLRPDHVEHWTVNSSSTFDRTTLNYREFAFKDISYFDRKLWEQARPFFRAFSQFCEDILREGAFLNRLKQANFDLAFAPIYDYCPIGLIHAAKIPTWIWLNPGRLMDLTAIYMGVPSPPSYVPPIMADYSDEMNFYQRFKSLLSQIIVPYFIERLFILPETELFRKYVDKNFPSLIDVTKSCPLVMVNSNELYSFAQPTLHKVIYIGGLGMKMQDAKPLQHKFKAIAEKGKRVVLMSFGSHADVTEMPEAWKTSFLESLSEFEDIEFIIRYPAADLNSRKPSNVHIEQWIPQTDLLQYENTKLLITHGGYNSIQEAIHASKPMIIIPLFGDQFTNAHLAMRYGFAYRINKNEFSQESLTVAIRAVLSDPSYTENAKRMNVMVRLKPGNSEDLLVEWTNFLLVYKTLNNFVPYGTKLNFIQYFCIDIIFTVFIALLFCIYICCKLMRVLIGSVRKEVLHKKIKSK